MEFIERTSLEQGFAPIFNKVVRPKLMSLESERLKLQGKAKKQARLVMLGFLAAAGAILAIAGTSTGTFVLAGVMVFLGWVGMSLAKSWQGTSWSGSVAAAVMPPICGHIGDLRHDADADAGFPVKEMHRLKVLGRYDNASLRDRLEGSHRGTKFEMVEAKLTTEIRDNDGGTRTNKVFDGLLFRIGVPGAVPTPILITRDYGKVGNTLGKLVSGKKGRGMPRVEMGHTAFEAAFEVHAENPDAARKFLSLSFLENLLQIGAQEGGGKGAKGLRAGFNGKSFYLALERGGEFLEMGSLDRPVAEMEEDLHAIFADIELVHRIIDRLHGS